VDFNNQIPLICRRSSCSCSTISSRPCSKRISSRWSSHPFSRRISTKIAFYRKRHNRFKMDDFGAIQSLNLYNIFTVRTLVLLNKKIQREGCMKQYRKSLLGLTISVPLFKKLRDIIFFLRDNNFMSHFEGHFEGAKTFLTPYI